MFEPSRFCVLAFACLLACAGAQASTAFQVSPGATHAAFGDNAANVCDADSGRNCIVSWTQLNQTAEGSWRRVFHDPAAFNARASRVAEEATSAADGFTGRSLVVVRDLKGRRYVADLR